MRKFFVRLKNWEYWPFPVLYFPVFFYYVWLGIRHRSFFFFTASNPSIDFGGMMGERKSDIFDLIPKEYVPRTRLVEINNFDQAKEFAEEIGYPVIVKPNIGERGILVQKIHSAQELNKYISHCPVEFLVQEFVDYPIELGVFYLKQPDADSGRITSIVRKEFLSVIGDGRSSVMDLLSGNDRAQVNANLESNFLNQNGTYVPKQGEYILVEPIGNHCRGTRFLNDNGHIDPRLCEAFDKLVSQIPDFHYGRFDLRCKSYEDLKELKNFKILELNGAGSEPGHIYQPGYSLWQAYKDIFWHLGVLAHISENNKLNGAVYWSFKRGFQKWRSHIKYKRRLLVK